MPTTTPESFNSNSNSNSGSFNSNSNFNSGKSLEYQLQLQLQLQEFQLQLQLRQVSWMSTPTPTPEVSTPIPTPTPEFTPTLSHKEAAECWEAPPEAPLWQIPTEVHPPSSKAHRREFYLLKTNRAAWNDRRGDWGVGVGATVFSLIASLDLLPLSCVSSAVRAAIQGSHVCKCETGNWWSLGPFVWPGSQQLLSDWLHQPWSGRIWMYTCPWDHEGGKVGRPDGQYWSL